RRRRARRPVPRRRAGGPGDGPARHRGNPQRVPLVGPRRATVPAGVPDPGDGGGAPACGTPDRRGAAAMTRTPVVLQMEAVECGPAALATVLAHHGRYVPLEELRLLCGVSRDGSKASMLIKAARAYGLAATGHQMEADDLAGLLRRVSGALVVAGFASLLLAVVGLVQPAFILAMVDALGTGAAAVPWPYFALMAAAVVVTAALTAVQQVHLARMQVVLSTLGHARFLRHLLRLPAGFFAQRSQADLTRRLQSNGQIAEILSRDVVAVLINAVLVATYAAVMWAYDVELAVVGA